jgi:hypothetical protein
VADRRGGGGGGGGGGRTSVEMVDLLGSVGRWGAVVGWYWVGSGLPGDRYPTQYGRVGPRARDLGPVHLGL